MCVFELWIHVCIYIYLYAYIHIYVMKRPTGIYHRNNHRLVGKRCAIPVPRLAVFLLVSF